jgi:hypothetical protein
LSGALAITWLLAGFFMGSGLAASLARLGQFMTWRTGIAMIVLGLMLFAAGFVL